MIPPGILCGFMIKENHARKSTPFGTILGITKESSTAWLGLRYATAARWEAPVMTLPWPGVYPATDFGATCPQQGNAESSAMQSEDCAPAACPHTPAARWSLIVTAL